MSLTEIVILVIGTGALMFFNWEFSVKARRFHGIFRFFSFESILLLIVVNWRVWFGDPFSWNQMISWVLLIGSVPLAIEGFRLLKVVGKPQGQFENTTKLVCVGLYRFIRHPLYASLMVLGLGVFFKQLSWTGFVLVLVNTAALFATARTEEKEMTQNFGSEYESYMQKTKMFVPYIF